MRTSAVWGSSDTLGRLPCAQSSPVRPDHAMVSFLSPSIEPNAAMHVYV